MGDHSHKNNDASESSNSQAQDLSPSGSSKPQGSHGQSRRRFLKAGLISVPMIVTLRGRPAHAQVSLGSVGNIFYGRYEMFLKDRGELPGATLGDGTQNTRTRWAPADQDGNEMVDPTRRDQNAGVFQEPTGKDAPNPNGGIQLDDWSPDGMQLDNWSPD